VPPSLFGQDEELLHDEVSLLRELDHPHIVGLYDFFVDAQNYYVVEEICDGGDVFERLIAKVGGVGGETVCCVFLLSLTLLRGRI
jgi:serine/threonine protein kinase